MEELIERHLNRKIIPRRIPLSQEIRRGIYLLVFTLLSLIVILNIVFLQSTTLSAQKGSLVQKEEEEKEALLLKNRELTTKKMASESLKKLEENEIVQTMENPKPESIIYIK